MDWVARKPFESIVLLLVVYYSGIVLFLEPVAFAVKINFISSAFGVWMVFLLFATAFRPELNKAKDSLFGVFLAGQFTGLGVLKKALAIVRLSLPILIITSFVEFALSTMFIKGGAVTIGFPLSVYSFSAGKLLYGNLLVNLILQVSVIYFVGYTLMQQRKKI